MRKWHLIIDVAKCEDCNNCCLACKDEHVGNEWPGYSLAQPVHGQRWINIMRKERGQFPLIDVAYLPTPCMHCDNAPCIAASNGACHKREDGIVIIDPVKSKGAKNLVAACPYHMIWWNEKEQAPQKCTLCGHLLSQNWRVPRCVQACPTGALRVEYVDDAAMKSIVAAEKLEVLHPEFGTKPRVYYKNMHRYAKCFIAGSVAIKRNGKVDCAGGATVILRQGQTEINETATDNFGDFWLDRLEPNSGNYTLTIVFPGYCLCEIDVTLATSVSIGSILLKPDVRLVG
jgi:Fe-S-cluster-containing dehydrogenase component